MRPSSHSPTWLPASVGRCARIWARCRGGSFRTSAASPEPTRLITCRSRACSPAKEIGRWGMCCPAAGLLPKPATSGISCCAQYGSTHRICRARRCRRARDPGEGWQGLPRTRSSLKMGSGQHSSIRRSPTFSGTEAKSASIISSARSTSRTTMCGPSNSVKTRSISAKTTPSSSRSLDGLRPCSSRTFPCRDNSALSLTHISRLLPRRDFPDPRRAQRDYGVDIRFPRQDLNYRQCGRPFCRVRARAIGSSNLERGGCPHRTQWRAAAVAHCEGAKGHVCRSSGRERTAAAAADTLAQSASRRRLDSDRAACNH